MKFPIDVFCTMCIVCIVWATASVGDYSIAYSLLAVCNLLYFFSVCDFTANKFFAEGRIKSVPTGVVWLPVPYLAALFTLLIIFPVAVVIECCSLEKTNPIEKPREMIKDELATSLWTLKIAKESKDSKLAVLRRLHDQCIYCGVTIGTDANHDDFGWAVEASRGVKVVCPYRVLKNASA